MSIDGGAFTAACVLQKQAQSVLDKLYDFCCYVVYYLLPPCDLIKRARVSVKMECNLVLQ